MKLYMFRTVRLSIIRSLFTVHSAMVYVIQVWRQLSSRSISNLTKIRPVRAEWLHEEGQTDIHDEVFRNSAKAPKL